MRARGRRHQAHPRSAGFTLIELLVALVVFAVMAALAYGGLDAIARTRGELARQEDDFRDLMRAVGMLDRDLREAVARPVLGNAGQTLPALAGSSNAIEFTRLGFANPQAETRSNLERVLYELDDGALKRGRYPVLDRVPTTAPQITALRRQISDFRLRYLDSSGRWQDTWPPQQASDPNQPPRAVEWRLISRDMGEIVRVIELVSSWPLNPATQGTGKIPPTGLGAGKTP